MLRLHVAFLGKLRCRILNLQIFPNINNLGPPPSSAPSTGEKSPHILDGRSKNAFIFYASSTSFSTTMQSFTHVKTERYESPSRQVNASLSFPCHTRAVLLEPAESISRCRQHHCELGFVRACIGGCATMFFVRSFRCSLVWYAAWCYSYPDPLLGS